MADLKLLLDGVSMGAPFELTKDLTIGGLELHAGDELLSKVVVGEEKRVVTIHEAFELMQFLEQSVTSLKLSFKCLSGSTIGGGSSTTKSSSVTKSVTLHNMDDLKLLLDGDTLDMASFKVTKDVTIGDLELHIGDVLLRTVKVGK